MSVIDLGKDSENLYKAQSGDEKSLEELFREASPLVEIIASKYINSPLEKEDLMQEGMIGLFRAIESYDESKGARFKTYAERCIDNAMKDAIKGATRRKDVPAESVVEYKEEAFTDSEDSAEEIYLHKERIERLFSAMEQKLSDLEKQVLSQYILGFGYSEIAKTLNKDEKSVDNALQRIKRKLGDDI